jgi:hypothetical protein
LAGFLCIYALVYLRNQCSRQYQFARYANVGENPSRFIQDIHAAQLEKRYTTATAATTATATI